MSIFDLVNQLYNNSSCIFNTVGIYNIQTNYIQLKFIKYPDIKLHQKMIQLLPFNKMIIVLDEQFQ